jgi:glycosyltransferase involved in cell wall biosynthesis
MIGPVRDERPRVSVGLPTRNGERYLREVLDSLLAQTHPAAEILISDNASTDRTRAIAEEYASRYPTVRYVRQARVIGAVSNFNAAFRGTSGDLFMWAADDDLWDSRYIEECEAALTARPEAVLAATRLQFIDPGGNPIVMDYSGYDNVELSTSSVRARLESLTRRHGWYQIYGLIRRNALTKTRLFQDRYGSDVVLLCELAILGQFALVPDILFSYRQYPERDETARAIATGTSAAAAAATPYTHLEEGLSDAISTSGLPLRTRLSLRAGLLRSIYLSSTVIGVNARAESPIRARTAAREMDWAGLAKYGSVAVAAATRRKAKELLRVP